jgi:hypothetical protein
MTRRRISCRDGADTSWQSFPAKRCFAHLSQHTCTMLLSACKHMVVVHTSQDLHLSHLGCVDYVVCQGKTSFALATEDRMKARLAILTVRNAIQPIVAVACTHSGNALVADVEQAHDGLQLCGCLKDCICMSQSGPETARRCNTHRKLHAPEPVSGSSRNSNPSMMGSMMARISAFGSFAVAALNANSLSRPACTSLDISCHDGALTRPRLGPH